MPFKEMAIFFFQFPTAARFTVDAAFNRIGVEITASDSGPFPFSLSSCQSPGRSELEGHGALLLRSEWPTPENSPGPAEAFMWVGCGELMASPLHIKNPGGKHTIDTPPSASSANK